MSPRSAAFLISVTGLLGSSGCINSPEQHASAPLSTGTTEARIEERARYIRSNNPSLSDKDARSLAASAIAGEDARAEIEWREKEKARAKQEKFEKDLAKLDR
jgi:hypothetical protein